MATSNNTPLDVRSRFGNTIRECRTRLGVSQEELAFRAGLHRTYLSDVERGARNPSLESIEKLARALEKPIDALFSEVEKVSKREAGSKRNGYPIKCVEILLVEDNPDDVELTLEAFRLARVKNRVHTVCDGEAAVKFLFCKGAYAHRRAGLRPLVVLLDLNLPKMNGLGVLQKIKRDERTRRIPVIVLTVSQKDRDIAECRRLGVEHYIVKPVGFHEFNRITLALQFDWALFQHTSELIS